MKELTEEELEKAVVIFKRREALFVADGLSPNEAYELADKLFVRDSYNPQDNRRLCFECNHHSIPKKTCSKILEFGKPTLQLRYDLQRCEHFSLRGKK